VLGYLARGTYIESIKTGQFAPFLSLTLCALAARFHHSDDLAKRTFAGLAILTALLSVLVQARLYYRFSWFNPRFRHGEDVAFIEFAREVGRRTTPRDTIGLWELGVVGYYSDRTILDFAGLATPEIVAYRRRYGADAIPRYLADRSGPPEYIVDALPKARAGEAELAERRFFGFSYRPLHQEKVRRIGGREGADHWYLYVLYQRAPAGDPASSP
jgi:hypothetical protein